MLNAENGALSREQFVLLRQAREVIKKEFSTVIRLSENNILEKIYKYSLDSEGEELFNIYNSLVGVKSPVSDAADVKSASDIPRQSIEASTKNPPGNRIEVGDVIDGKKVTSIYRGRPVFAG